MRKAKEKARVSARSLLLYFIILAVCASLFSCGEAQKSCSEELGILLGDTVLPVGETYVCGAEEASEGYLSPDTARALYGEDAGEILALCEDFAIFVSSRPNPFEAAVFRCYSASDCDRVAAMLLSRINEVQIALRSTSIAGAYDTAEVTVRGRTVMMRGGVQNISK